MGKITNQSNNKGLQAIKRKSDVTEVQKRILIVCEGEKTEPQYFEDLKVDLELSAIQIKIEGIGHNTLSLVNYAISQKSERYDEIWCVFDKDSFKNHQFDDAIAKARNKGLKVAYSNECFELWYILHFEYLNTDIGREQYCKKLDELLGKKYKKIKKELIILLKTSNR